jgi:pimeloyl-ACP methyl ester carboxylesterase
MGSSSFETDVTGFVAVDITKNLIVVSFRGTESKRNLYVDMGYHLIPSGICPGCEASHGFAVAWNETRQAVMDVIDRVQLLGNQKRIVTVGHSLGGAIAGLAAADLRSKGYYTDMVRILIIYI